MIVVGGEALVDLLVRPDGSVVATPGGGPYNTARTIGRLGVPVTFVGRLSNDRFGLDMAARLKRDGVVLGCPAPLAEPTTLALAELDRDGQATYRFYLDGTSAPRLMPADLAGVQAASFDAIHVGTLGLAVEPMAATLETFVEGLRPDVLVMLDPNCRPSAIADPEAYRGRLERVLHRADVVKVSREDLAYLRPGEVPAVAAHALLGSTGKAGPAAVLVTAGAEEVAVITRSGAMRLAVPPAAIVDTVGAGDAFGGAFLAWWVGARLGRASLTDDGALHAAVQAAIAVAALTCQRPGAEPPRLSELPRDWASRFDR
jgi:fructokinase